MPLTPESDIDEQVPATEEVETPAAEVEEDDAPTNSTFDGDTIIPLRMTSRKQRGKDVQLPIAKPVFDISAEGIDATWQRITKLFKWIGLPNVVASLTREVLAPAALEASEKGFANEEFDHVQFWEAFRATFDPRERKKGGPTLKEIGEKLVALANELLEFVTKLSSGEPLSEPEQNRFAQIKIEHVKLTELKAKKERRGKAPKAKPAAEKAK